MLDLDSWKVRPLTLELQTRPRKNRRPVRWSKSAHNSAHNKRQMRAPDGEIGRSLTRTVTDRDEQTRRSGSQNTPSHVGRRRADDFSQHARTGRSKRRGTQVLLASRALARAITMTSLSGASLHGGMRFLRPDFYRSVPPDDKVAHMVTAKPTFPASLSLKRAAFTFPSSTIS
jgi:hypothetical protein